MEIPTLQTRRLVLRPWSPNDAEAWFEILREEGILRYFPDPSPRRVIRQTGTLRTTRHWDEHGYGHWAFVAPTDSRVVGGSGLEYLPELRATEVAYLLGRRVWGHASPVRRLRPPSVLASNPPASRQSSGSCTRTAWLPDVCWRSAACAWPTASGCGARSCAGIASVGPGLHRESIPQRGKPACVDDSRTPMVISERKTQPLAGFASM
jgi:hypothetical protein